MTIEEAITNAIEYEKKVVHVYADAMERSKDPVGKRIFKVFSVEEEGHVSYLKQKLEQLKCEGKVTPETLKTAVPAIDCIEKEIGKLERRMADRELDEELQMLQKAREVEIETGNFYRRMVAELPEEGKQFFKRFVEIEEGHLALVQAEIDAITKSGYWFDFADFSLEALG